MRPDRFAGTENALYERHLLFDKWSTRAAATPRERFEAFARSVRDVLSQRWVLTEADLRAPRTPKRAYYLSMEFLIGRSLANNVTNLLLDPSSRSCSRRQGLDWLDLLEQEPDAGSGQRRPGTAGGLLHGFDGHAAAPGDGLWAALRVRHFQADRSATAGSRNSRITGCARPDPWEVARPHEKVEVQLNCSFEVQRRDACARSQAGRRP